MVTWPGLPSLLSIYTGAFDGCGAADAAEVGTLLCDFVQRPDTQGAVIVPPTLHVGKMVMGTKALDFDRDSPCFLGRLSGNATCTQYLLHGQRCYKDQMG